MTIVNFVKCTHFAQSCSGSECGRALWRDDKTGLRFAMLVDQSREVNEQVKFYL